MAGSMIAMGAELFTGDCLVAMSGQWNYSAGLLASCNPEYVEIAMNTYGYSHEYLETLNITNYFLANLLPVTIGNIIGGAVCVGAPVYYLNRDKVS